MIFDFGARESDSPLVEFIWSTRTDSDSGGEFLSTAATHSEMVVTRQYGKTTLSIRGPESKASPAPVPEDAEFFGIVFKLGTFMPKLPPIQLVNEAVHLQESSYNSIWLGSAWQIPNYENADTFISRLIREGLLVYDPLVNAVMENKPLDLSLRTVQRRFLQATGLSHITIKQIERAKEAVTLLEQGLSILDTVSELSYSDQAHLTRSLKQFMGQTPAQVIRARED
jgi:hypothetical protein